MAEILAVGEGASEGASAAARTAQPLPDYDPDASQGAWARFITSLGVQVAVWLASPRNRLLRLLRFLWPVVKLPGWAFVIRYEHVAEVLGRHDVFKVPFGEEIARLNDGSQPGTPFLLGMDDELQHAAQLKLVLPAFARKDIAGRVVPIAHAAAERALDGVGAKTFDAIHELITAVPLALCREYYGVTIDDPRKFAYATMELSGYLFGPPPLRKRRTTQVEAAGAYVRAVVDRSIAHVMKNPPGKDTVLERLVNQHNKKPDAPSIAQIRAFLIGMIVGFVPTNTIAGGNILEMLLREPAYLERASRAAHEGDDDLLKHCLFEAMRFMPLNLGPFRCCSRDFVLGANSSRPALIRKGTKVLASTASAMADTRQIENPRDYKPDRPASDYMLFGYGMHFCAGVFIAQAQITQTLKALLGRGAPRRAGPLRRRGIFPDNLLITIE